jgi:polyribonucleotide nucleotidyltransferase
MVEDKRTQLSLELGGRTLTIETGEMAKQADGSVVIRMGDTVVLAVATMGEPRQGMDFFPLSVDYEERLYAAGKIPGGFIKREGRPTEKAILTSRLIDRPIRPLFPSGCRNEVQVVAMPLSVDTENPPDILAMVGASAALCISKVPFEGPVGAVRIGRVNGEFIVNPTFQELAESDLDLVVAGTREAVTTIEAGMLEIPEEDVVAAIKFAHESYLPMIDLQEELVRRVGSPKAAVTVSVADPELVQVIRDQFADTILNAIQDPDKASREEGTSLLTEEIVGKLVEDYPERESDLYAAVAKVVKEQVRRLIMEF